MYIFLIIAIIIPIIGLPLYCLGYISKQKEYQVIGWLFLAYFMGIMGYCFQNPLTDPDIVRYLEMVEAYANLNFADIFNAGNYANLYIIDLWFWVIAQTGNYQLVAFTSCFFSYVIFLYILLDYSNRNCFTTNLRIVSIVLMFGLINFCLVVNAIRSVLAFALILLAVYKEVYQKRKNVGVYILYIVPLLMHFASISLIVMRLVLIIRKRWIKILSLFIVFVPLYIEPLATLTRFMPLSIPFASDIKYFSERVLMYFKWNEGGWASAVQNSGFYSLNKIFTVCVLIFTLLIYWRIKRLKKPIFNNEFDTFIILYFAIIFACFAMATPTYQRFSVPIWVFCIIIITQYLSVRKRKDKYYYLCVLFMLLFGMVGYFLNMYMLNTMIPIDKYASDVLTFNWVGDFLLN